MGGRWLAWAAFTALLPLGAAQPLFSAPAPDGPVLDGYWAHYGLAHQGSHDESRDWADACLASWCGPLPAVICDTNEPFYLVTLYVMTGAAGDVLMLRNYFGASGVDPQESPATLAQPGKVITWFHHGCLPPPFAVVGLDVATAALYRVEILYLFG